MLEQMKKKDKSDKTERGQSFQVEPNASSHETVEAEKAKLMPSEHAAEKYDPVMSAISVSNEAQMAQKIKQAGFSLREDSFQNGIVKYCCKNDWESTMYLIKYGNYEATLRIIAVNLEPRVLCSSFISKGNFGEVFRFEMENKKSFALKNIRVDNESSKSIDQALKEVFIAKLFSALEIGPQFSTIFSYDAVLFRGSLQYAMEVCQTDYNSKDFPRVQESSLLRQLKTMHSLNICHFDIKVDNIGWSPAFHKLVFLDFGLTAAIQAPVGYKTETEFKGTYNYCSPEMKKLYYLKKSAFVDSYYNDLHCLQKSWKQISEMKAKQKQNIKAEQFYHISNNSEEESSRLEVSWKAGSFQSAAKVTEKQNEALVRFFRVKFCLFDEDYSEVERITCAETLLVEAFRKQVSIERENSQQNPELFGLLSRVYTEICRRSQLMKQKNSRMCGLDATLLEYLVKNDCKSQLASVHKKLEEVLNKKANFAKEWSNEEMKVKAFSLIDVYSNNDQELRRKLMDRIYEQVASSEEEMSRTMQFREILLYYAGYFSEKKDTTYLERIMTYFDLMGDEHSSEKLKDRILEIHLQKEKYLDWLRDNFKFFLGKVMACDRKALYTTKKDIQRMQFLPQKLINQKQSSPQFKKLLEATIQEALVVKHTYHNLSYIRQNDKQFKELTHQFQDNFGHYFTPSISQFIQTVIQSRQILDEQNQHLLLALKSDDIYLNNCCFIMKIRSFLLTNKINSLGKLLKSEPFTNQFPVYSYLMTLSQKLQRQYFLRQKICKDYLKITDNESLIIDIFYMNALSQIFLPSQIEVKVLQFLQTFELRRIDSLSKLVHFMINFEEVFSYIFMSNQNLGREFSKSFSIFFCEIFSSFLEYTSSAVKSLEKCLKDDDRNEVKEDFNACAKEIEISGGYLRIFINLIEGKIQESFDILVKIIDIREKINGQTIMLSILLAIEERSPIQSREKFHKFIIQHMCLLIKQMKLGSILSAPRFLQKAVEIHLEQKKYDSAVFFIESHCRFVNTVKTPAYRYGFIFIVMENFVLFTSTSNLAVIARELASRRMEQFCEYPIFTYFFALIYASLKKEKQEMLRLLTICIMFTSAFPDGFFSGYKKFLQFQKSQTKLKKTISSMYSFRRQKFQPVSRLKKYIDHSFLVTRRKKSQREEEILEIIRNKMKEKCNQQFENISIQ